MSKLSNVSCYVTEKISVDSIDISEYITTDNLLQNKKGRVIAEKLPTQKVTRFKKNDILIANIRPYLKKIWQADIDGGASSDVLVVRPNDVIDNNFLYYALTQDSFFEYVMKGSKGTKMPRGDKSQIMNFVIPDLEIDEQIKIGKLLKSIDQKIQINNQINQELETMAKTLYDYWFVQFDFPDQNGHPYKSSGGKMVYNPELKREIPEGWGVEKLSEFLVLNKDKYNKELNWQKIHYLETSNLIENKIEKLKKIDIKSDKIPSRAKEIVKDRDILYSLVRPNQMHFGFIRNPIQNLVASTGFVLLSCEDNPIYNIFFYLFMTLPNNVRRMIKLSESSTSSYPSIRPEDILNMEIVTPYDFSNYRSLVEYLDKIYYQIDVLYKQNEALIQLRDWLLPMLMNGQVKVE